MKTPEQLKGTIRSMAAKKNLRAQEILQMFLFERVLERLANSAYKNNFILKGGLLISSMIGIGERTTMDMDTTVRGIQMEEDEIVKAVKEILAVDVGDGIVFEYQGIEPIREDDAYNNFRVHLRAKYGKIDSPMKIDVTTGDVITPAAIQYDFPMLFDDKSVPVMAYTLETILAEKYETIIRRNIGTTRARDYYDLHTLYRSRKDEVRLDVLKAAVLHPDFMLRFAQCTRGSKVRDESCGTDSVRMYGRRTPYEQRGGYNGIFPRLRPHREQCVR